MDQALGMMDEGYFCPRGEILQWINETCQLQITKIEQLGTGSVYCQILDSCFPNQIPLQKVTWNAKNEYEFICNLKILQQSFNKLNIKRHIEIDKLCKARYQDNLEFAQWIKRFASIKGQDKEYDPIKRRGTKEVDFSFADKIVIPKHFNKQKIDAQLQKYKNSRSTDKRPRDASAFVSHKKVRDINFEVHKLLIQKIKNICKDENQNEQQKISLITELTQDY